MTLRFDDALRVARRFLEERGSEVGRPLVLVRDLFGRFRLAIDDRGQPVSPPSGWVEDFQLRLGPFAGAGALLLASQMTVPEELFASPDRIDIELAGQMFGLVERLVTTADWTRPALERSPATRLAFHGIKGGVGRSTALAMLARRFAEQGRSVVVFDLDLESPGVASMLLAAESYPRFGLVDWLVEDSVDQADDSMLDEIWSASPLAQGTSGSIRVVPAHGKLDGEYAYLPKLARSYVGVLRGDMEEDFGDRIRRAINAIEERLAREAQPSTIALIDARAGLHDLAAVAVTGLGARTLLFAMDSPQTWLGYRLLFSEWQKRPKLARQIRDRLKLVAAQVPETETSAYLQRFRARGYELFQDHLYDEAESDDVDAFNFDPDDPDAPHSPLRINWSRSLVQIDPVGDPEALTPEQIEAAFSEFFRGVDGLISEVS